jgi:hypothetical protein
LTATCFIPTKYGASAKSTGFLKCNVRTVAAACFANMSPEACKRTAAVEGKAHHLSQSNHRVIEKFVWAACKGSMAVHHKRFHPTAPAPGAAPPTSATPNAKDFLELMKDSSFLAELTALVATA